MFNTKKLYDISPIFFQNIMTSIYGRKLMKKRYGNTYNIHLEFLRNNFYEMDHYAFQLKSLNNLLQYISIKSPYYGEQIVKEHLPLKLVSEMEDLPTLTKEILRSKINEVITAPKNTMSPSFTGGTTGKSLNVFYDYDDGQKRMAFLDFFKERHGVLFRKLVSNKKTNKIACNNSEINKVADSVFTPKIKNKIENKT